MSPTSCHCSTPLAKYRQRGANRQMRSLFPVFNWEPRGLPVGDTTRKVRDVRATGGAQRQRRLT